MIFFFGTRPGKQEIKQLPNCRCLHCEQRDTLTLLTRSNYVHIFWIKLFKISSFKIIECNHCKRRFYENELTEEMRSAMNQ